MSTTSLAINVSAYSPSGISVGGGFMISSEEITSTLASITVTPTAGLQLNLCLVNEQFIRILRVIPESFRPTLETHVAVVGTFYPPYQSSYNFFVSIETDGSIKLTKPNATDYGGVCNDPPNCPVAPNLFGAPLGAGVVCPEFTFVIGQLRL